MRKFSKSYKARVFAIGYGAGDKLALSIGSISKRRLKIFRKTLKTSAFGEKFNKTAQPEQGALIEGVKQDTQGCIIGRASSIKSVYGEQSSWASCN